MALDPLLVKIVLGGKPSEKELRRWLSRKIVKGRQTEQVQKILDMPSKIRILASIARYDPKTLLKATALRKLAKAVHRNLFMR